MDTPREQSSKPKAQSSNPGVSSHPAGQTADRTHTPCSGAPSLRSDATETPQPSRQSAGAGAVAPGRDAPLVELPIPATGWRAVAAAAGGMRPWRRELDPIGDGSAIRGRLRLAWHGVRLLLSAMLPAQPLSVEQQAARLAHQLQAWRAWHLGTLAARSATRGVASADPANALATVNGEGRAA